MNSITSEHFSNALVALLDETFANVQGFYLDKGTSLFETLAGITAAEASIAVGGKCATLAAQVKHIAFYLDVLEDSVRNQYFPEVDWDEIWRTVSTVTPDEWEALIRECRLSYHRILKLVEDQPAWSNEAEVGGAMAMIAHTAYHLGEIRQALCTIQA